MGGDSTDIRRERWRSHRYRCGEEGWRRRRRRRREGQRRGSGGIGDTGTGSDWIQQAQLVRVRSVEVWGDRKGLTVE